MDIIGDWRRGGVYSYQAECIARMPANELAAVLIKAQHNCVSDSTQYANMKLPRILHEYIILWSKPKRIMSMLSDLSMLAKQQQGRLSATWKAVVRSVMISLGGEANLSALYAKIAENAPEKLRDNPNWQAKIRQVLNQNLNEFSPVERGVWKLAA